MGSRTIVFDGDSLLKLLTAFTDGNVPLDAKLINIGVSAFLQRWLGLFVQSEQWPKEERLVGKDELAPLVIRYEGKKVLKWFQSAGKEPEWTTDFEVPKRK